MTTTSNKTGLGSYFLDTLFDFEARPGRYSLVLREPEVLFDNARKIFTLCLGRAIDGETIAPSLMPRAQQAACFFVRTALMRSSADHYTLMGVQPGFRDETLRDHYRLLMRLTHPDYASSSNQWPADAATRINRANEVLSSAVQRAQYDQELAATMPIARPAARPTPDVRRVLTPTPARAKTPAAYWAIPGAIAAVCLVVFVILPAAEGTKFMTDAKPTTVVAQATAEKPVHKTTDKPDPERAVPEPPKPQAQPEPAPEKVNISAVVPETKPAPKQTLAAAPVVASVAKPEKTFQQNQKPARQEAPAPQPTRPVAVLAATQPLRALAVTATTPSAEPRVSVEATPPPPPAPVPEPVKAEEKEPPALGLTDTQTQMNLILQAMQSGNGQNLIKSVERSAAARSDGLNALVRVYTHLVGESRQIKLGSVQLRGRNDADRLIVDGIVPLHLQDQGSPAPIREIRMRAIFVLRGGQALMTQIGPGGSAQ